MWISVCNWCFCGVLCECIYLASGCYCSLPSLLWVQWPLCGITGGHVCSRYVRCCTTPRCFACTLQMLCVISQRRKCSKQTSYLQERWRGIKRTCTRGNNIEYPWNNLSTMRPPLACALSNRALFRCYCIEIVNRIVNAHKSIGESVQVNVWVVSAECTMLYLCIMYK